MTVRQLNVEMSEMAYVFFLYNISGIASILYQTLFLQFITLVVN